jgi:hypothetical protein
VKTIRQRKKQANITLGIILMPLTLASFVYAGLTLHNPLIQEVDPRQAMADSADQCKEYVKKTGLDVISEKPKPFEFYVKNQSIKQWKESLMLTSYIIASCPKMEMTEFCLGSQCNDKADAIEQRNRAGANKSKGNERRVKSSAATVNKSYNGLIVKFEALKPVNSSN